MVICNDLVCSIKMWISLKIPRIEDGNNLGVVVQEEHVSLLTGMESAVSKVMADSISSICSRGDYVLKVILYFLYFDGIGDGKSRY